MAYTTIDNPAEYFTTTLYTGNGSSQSITGLSFKPDFVWIKSRSNSQNNYLYDAVRGASKQIYSDTNNAENTDTGGVNAFNSDGFTIGSSGENANGYSQVAWTWKANGSGSSNTVGSINSTVSANTTSGFSIVKYTGTQSAGTIGHGLGIAPKMIFLKNLAIADEWLAGANGGSVDFTTYAYLNLTNAFSGNASAFFNDTNPTSTLFSVGNSANINKNGSAIIAYCFSNVQGFSKIGSYKGNGNNNGSFTYLGFKPAFLIVKRTDTGNSWYVYTGKTSTSGGNLTDKYLEANATAAEATTTGEYGFNFLSNGFKATGTGGGTNNSSGTYIYLAFAESPLVTSTGIPATAR